MDIQEIRVKASAAGLFLPVIPETDALQTSADLHGVTLKNRAVLQMRVHFDADENGAPTAETTARYLKAVREKEYGILYLEPAALNADARAGIGQMILSKSNTGAFSALCAAIRDASVQAHGSAPVIIALLDHAGHKAIVPAAAECSPTLISDAPLLTDLDLTRLVIACGEAAASAEQAGASGIALNVCGRNLFGESLSAYHREGKFGGDFDDRSRFVRDCYTAMKMTTENVFFSIRLCLSDGIPQPDGWGMTVSGDTPDIYEASLLLKILRTLYGVELVSCEIGIPDINWMMQPEAESEMLRLSRLCTCVAMVDSNLQQNVQLILPELEHQTIPFQNLAAGMIQGEFASFAGYLK
ncbi:MAG: hypothetical protein IKI58_04335 [Oscillospiraceae bacterium]|nr:hypothetical protein [Oscillospiraceae bacterium]